MLTVNKIVCLLSGGLDSQILLAKLIKEGNTVVSLNIDYNQCNRLEIDCARKIAKEYKIPHYEWCVSLGHFNPLTNLSMDVPKSRRIEDMTNIADTYIPGRNTVLLSMGVSLAAQLGYGAVAIGVHHTDHAGYPDCRESYIESYNTFIQSIHPTIKIMAPFGNTSKRELGTLAKTLGVLTHMSSSCYHPVEGRVCGVCDACILRKDTLCIT